MINLSNFQMMHIALFSILIITLTIVLIEIIIEYLLTKRVNVLSAIFFIASIVYGSLNVDNQLGKTLFTVWQFLLLVWACYTYIKLFKDVLCKQTIHNKLIEHIKNDSADYYFCLNNKQKLIDYSISFINDTRLSKKEIAKYNGIDLLFKTLNIKKINDSEAIKANIELFKSHLIDATSKYNMYDFTLTILSIDQDLKTYNCLMQPIYLNNKLIGQNIYMYLDKTDLVKEVNDRLNQSLVLLSKQKNILNILMSLSEGVAMYFDYQEKMYYATQSFADYLGINKKEFTFQEFLSFIVESDRDTYIEQSETVNSMNVTRIKFRMRINNNIYNAIEDSIYLTKNGNEFVSLIHITNKITDFVPNEILSTKETVELLKTLSENVITPVVYETESALNKVLKENNNDK